jgi:hypothetical protein
MQDDFMQLSVAAARSSPAGRPIRVRESTNNPPQWVAKRRRAYRWIDRVADGAKNVVRRWLVPRPANAGRLRKHI